MMERPQFRTDLVSQPIQQEGKTFVDVTDPDSGKTFRFYEVEYAVACAMDGQRDVAGIVTWAQEELGLAPSVDEVQMVISTLKDLGYVRTAGGPTPVRAAASAPSVVSGAGRPSAAAQTPQPDPGDFDIDISLGAAGGSDVATGSQPIAAGDFELGASGGAAPARPEPAPNADFSLGAPGAGGRGEPLPHERPGIDPLAATTNVVAIADTAPPPMGDVSIDLSSHLPVQPNDVKEALRQSKVMPVAVPPTIQPAMQPAPSQNDPRTARQPLGGGVPLPERPPTASAAVAQAPARAKKKSGALTWVLLFLLLAAGAAAAYYYFVYLKQDAKPIKKAPPTTAVKPKPPAPKPILASLVKGKANDVVISSPRPGQVMWLAEPGVELASGAVVARFKGADRKQSAFDAANTKLQQAKEKLTAANAAGKASAIKSATTAVERYQKRADRAKATYELEIVTAKDKGVVSRKVEPSARVKLGDDLVTLTYYDGPTATFTVPSGDKFKAGQDAVLQLKEKKELELICKVSSVAGNAVEVACPEEDAGFKAGDSVVLKP